MKKIYFVGLVICLFLVIGHVNLAQAQGSKVLQYFAQTGAQSGLPQSDINSPKTIIMTGVRLFLGLLGAIFLVLVVYAGFLRFTAGGNEEQISKSNNYIVNAVIGLLIVVSAYSITTLAYRISTTNSGGKSCASSSQCGKHEKCNMYGKCVDVTWCESSADCSPGLICSQNGYCRSQEICAPGVKCMNTVQ